MTFGPKILNSKSKDIRIVNLCHVRLNDQPAAESKVSYKIYIIQIDYCDKYLLIVLGSEKKCSNDYGLNKLSYIFDHINFSSIEFVSE